MKLSSLAIRSGSVAVSLIVSSGSFANLVSNGGFEEGLDGWYGSFASGGSGVMARTTGSIGSGDYLFRGDAPGSFMSSTIGQVIDVAQGQRLRLEFDISASGGGIVMVRQAYSTLYTTIDLLQMSAVGGPHRSFEFDAAADDIAVEFWFSGFQAGTFDLDNVSVTAVPAPGAIALLGLAGLRGRRRR
jgi:MYXO-CTERM domain-containing protein